MINQIQQKLGLARKSQDDENNKAKFNSEIEVQNISSTEEKHNNSVFDKLKMEAQMKYDQFRQSELTQRVSNAVQEKVKIIDNTLKSVILQQKEKINMWMKLKFQEQLLKYIEKQKPTVINKMKDPDMCECVKRSIDSIGEELWPAVMEEVKFQLQMNLSKPVADIPVQKVHCLCLPIRCFTSWYNYTTKPYDRSIWKSIKTVSWWIICLISMFPYFGVQACFFIFDFLCLDKSDEFQLVNYILSYKKSQFISQGFLLASLGYFLYFNCVTMIQSTSTNPYLECSNIGPGAGSSNIYEMILFLSQIAFLWISFLMLPCSKPKAIRFKYQSISDQEAQRQSQIQDTVEDQGCCCFTCNFKRGGALTKFMIYDIFTFGASIGVYFWTYNESLAKDYDQSNAQIFMAKIVYGLLSLPFMIFMVTPLGQLLTKSRPTGYDKFGNTVPQDSRIAINYQGPDPSKEFQHQFSVDIEEIFD